MKEDTEENNSRKNLLGPQACHRLGSSLPGLPPRPPSLASPCSVCNVAFEGLNLSLHVASFWGPRPFWKHFPQVRAEEENNKPLFLARCP